MKKTVVSWVFVLGLIMHSWGVTFAVAKPDPMRELLKSAFERYSQGQYFEAIRFYQKVLSMDETRSEAHYYLGDCFRYLFQYELALQHYQQVQEEHLPAYPLLTIHMGLVHKSLGNYDQAAHYFKIFVEEIPQKKLQDNQYWVNRAKGELHSLSVIRQSPLAPMMNVDIAKLSAPVNSLSHDLAAVPYRGLDSMLIVTSTRSDSRGNHYHDQHGESFSDNFLFVMDSNRWEESPGTHRFSTINSPLDEGPGTFSDDQQTYFFTKYTSKGDYHLFTSAFSNDQWQSPSPLPSPINLPGYISKHPALTSSGDTLFFSSNRPDGYGESDLWMSVRANGEWQLPTNLGPKVNTPYQETSPHWNASHRRLFFASNGHPGWGGYDLFMTSIRPSQSLKPVINLGKPLNSSKDDTYIWVGENTGYITSNRDSIAGNFDIFMYQYKSGPKLLLSLTTQSFWDTWTARFYAELTEEKQQEAHRLFSSLPSQAQEALQRTVRQRIFEALSSENLISEDIPDEFQQLTSMHGNKVQELADSKLAFYLSFQIPSSNEETQRWFSTLSPEEKEQMERVTQWLVLKTLLQQTEASVSEEKYTYEELSPEKRTWIDQAAERGKRDFQNVANDFISLDELFQWQTLPAEEKERLQLELTYQYFTSVLLYDEPSINNARHHYEQLPHEKQQQIDRIAYALIVQEKDGDALALNESAFLPDSLSQEEQRTLYRMVVYRSVELRKKHASEPNADIRYWEELPKEAKNAIQRAVTTRHFTEQAVSDFSVADEASHQQINLHALVEAKPDLVTIRGKLSLENSLSNSTTVALGDRYKRLSTKTQPDGSFIFERVKYQQSQQLFIGQKGSSMAEMLSYHLEELEITVVQDSIFLETFDNLYFDTNEHDLAEEAMPVLARIADFHQRYPDISIQIHTYADSVGSQAYNFQLSKRRGETVLKSLVERRVDSDRLVIVPKGKEQLEVSKALSYSRRVEFKITGTNTTYNPTRKIYLLAAHPDLNKIAERYSLSLDQILSLNPGLSTHPSPYTIIKIVTNQQKYVE